MYLLPPSSNGLEWLQKSWDQVSWEAQLPLRLPLTSSGSLLHMHFSKCGLLLKYLTGRWPAMCFPPCVILGRPGCENCLSGHWTHMPKLASLQSELYVRGFPPMVMDTAREEPGTASRASTTRKSHLLWNRNSRGEAFSGKCDENRKQESKSPVSTFHRQSF